MATNSFKPAKFQDISIVDAEGITVGHIRVKPSGILWAPPHAKVWYGLSIRQFAEFAETHGKKQKK